MRAMSPLRQLTHDHAALNARVRELGARLRGLGGEAGTAGLAAGLVDLREHLFLHFAREEEGLIPFVTEQVPELAERVGALALAHDAICGALARMCHLAKVDAPAAGLVALFDRFATSYATHAEAEARLLEELEVRLDPDQRARLGELVAGL